MLRVATLNIYIFIIFNSVLYAGKVIAAVSNLFIGVLPIMVFGKEKDCQQP